MGFWIKWVFFFQEVAVKASSAVLLMFPTLTIMMARGALGLCQHKAPNVVPLT